MKFIFIQFLIFSFIFAHFCCSNKNKIGRWDTWELVEVYVEEHPNLPKKDKICILEGRFEIGMHNQSVFFLAGEPAKIDTLEQEDKQYIKWYYKRRDLPKELEINAFVFSSEGYLIEIIKRK